MRYHCSILTTINRLNQFALAACVFVLVFCAGSVEAANYQYIVAEGEIRNSGSISGTILFDGTPPAPSMLKADTDEVECGSDIPNEELLVGDNGGIHNVVLSIEDITSGKAWDLPVQFVYYQKQCRFNPHVMIIKAKSPGTVRNGDDIIHNVHTISRGIFSFNKASNGHSEIKIRAKKIRKPGVVRVKCDIHNWMRGWWIVAKNPYTVVTNQDGEFEIDNIPAGKYSIKIWHEKLGERDYSIEVKAGKVARLDVALS